MVTSALQLLFLLVSASFKPAEVHGEDRGRARDGPRKMIWRATRYVRRHINDTSVITTPTESRLNESSVLVLLNGQCELLRMVNRRLPDYCHDNNVMSEVVHTVCQRLQPSQ